MAFVKVVKNKAYFKRYQVKYRRRREGKTDFYARQRLIIQDKNKYQSPKYRLVVRITNHDVIVQVVYAQIEGDRVMTAAYAHELPRYGITVGLTNYASCYCVGLLAARRLLTKLGLADKYEGQVEPTGELYQVEELADGPRPFTAFLDVGLARTTTGARVFACMKGAVDGGLNIPHNEKRFAGYDAESKSLDAEVLRKRIFGEHLAEYFSSLKDDDEEAYKERFSRYVAAGVDEDNIADLFQEAHAKIRADPLPQKKEAKKVEKKRWTKKSLTYKQRKNKVEQRKAAFQRSLGKDE